MPSIEEWFRATYTKLELDTAILENLTSKVAPHTVFAPIISVITSNPEKYRGLVDEIVHIDMVRAYLCPGHRNQLSMLYPEDAELALRLLIDTTTYYKYDDYSKTYRLISTCPDVYFTRNVYYFHGKNPALKKALEENGVNTAELIGYKINSALVALYKKRNPTIMIYM
jgi:hypothetical protein